MGDGRERSGHRIRRRVATSALAGLVAGAIAGVIHWPAEARAADAIGAAATTYERRHDRLPDGDTAGRMRLAAWAETQGLADRAETAYRGVLAHDPRNVAARDAVGRLAALRPLPRTSAACDDAWRRLGPDFQIYETKRYIVLSDADPRWAQDQAELLERTYHQFERFARRHRLRPLPLRHKLVCLLFEERRDYQNFASAEDEVEDPWIAGYYAPANDRVVFYHGDSNPSVVEAQARLTSMRSDLEDLRREAGDAQRLGDGRRHQSLVSHRRRYQAHVERESGRVAQFAQNVNTATSVHEAVHQLLFHTMIQTPHHPYPVWFSEGLATAFETDATKGAFGPDHEYAPRRQGFDAMLHKDDLVNVRRFVSLMRVPNDERVIYAVYHQSYALITWMDRFRRKELRRYVDLMLAEPPGPLTPDRAVEVFAEAFGDVDRLERAWLRHERGRLTARAQ